MSSEPGQNEEVYDYPGEYTTKSDGQRYIRMRLEEREACSSSSMAAAAAVPSAPAFISS